MQSSELVQAAATIASGMVATTAARGQIEETTMNTLARTSVELALKIEQAAKRALAGPA